MVQDMIVENRLAILEREVAEIKSRLHSSKSNWLERVTGSMETEPDYSLVLELGRAARQADRPADE